MNKYVVIVAGGKGLRMGGDLPKQFMPLEGKPVLMRTMETFYRYDSSLHLILVLPRDHQAYWSQLCATYDWHIPYVLADGGTSRFESVRNGLSCIQDVEEALVAVHDGVRPFVSHNVIRRCFEEAQRSGAVVPVVPVVETVRQISDKGSRTVNRDDYRLVQTPQVFRWSVLKKAYGQPYDERFTDDASVVEASSFPVTLVEGNRENIKLTTPYDLVVAKALLECMI